MKIITIKKDWVIRARDRAVLDTDERQTIASFLKSHKDTYTLDVQLVDLPKPLWKTMLGDARLPANTRSAIALFIYGMRQGDVQLNSLYDTMVDNAVDFGTSLQIQGNKAPNCEYYLNGRWYPVILTVTFLDDEHKSKSIVQLNCILTFGERSIAMTHTVTNDVFSDESSDTRERTILQVLEYFGYRRLQTSTGEFNLRLVKAERAATEHGKVVMITGSVIMPSGYSWWRGFDTRALGSVDMPSRCVVEPALEVEENERDYYYRRSQYEESVSRLPFVRIFCLETKSYAYADVDDVHPYEFDSDALSRLHLPSDMHSILKRVFNTPIEKMFGDLLKGKHGGVVVLASGEPGVGKTLTAEIYAETTERPLYVLELGELGTTASEVEERLQQVFARVTRWNAVLQFDECEIFLATRGTDLERSAIVGIFLRLLDYYRGLLFLTTNRPANLDEAILSRVMIRLEYPHLEAETRSKIWQSMFTVANLQLQECSFDELGSLDLNGRQIRNLTRLAKILFPESVITRNAINEVLRFGCKASLS